MTKNEDDKNEDDKNEDDKNEGNKNRWQKMKMTKLKITKLKITNLKMTDLKMTGLTMTKMNIFLYYNGDTTGGDAVPREGRLGQQALPQQVPFQLRSTNQQQQTHTCQVKQ